MTTRTFFQHHPHPCDLTLHPHHLMESPPSLIDDSPSTDLSLLSLHFDLGPSLEDSVHEERESNYDCNDKDDEEDEFIAQLLLPFQSSLGKNPTKSSKSSATLNEGFIELDDLWNLESFFVDLPEVSDSQMAALFAFTSPPACSRPYDYKPSNEGQVTDQSPYLQGPPSPNYHRPEYGHQDYGHVSSTSSSPRTGQNSSPTFPSSASDHGQGSRYVYPYDHGAPSTSYSPNGYQIYGHNSQTQLGTPSHSGLYSVSSGHSHCQVDGYPPPTTGFPTASVSVNLSMNMTMGFSASGSPAENWPLHQTSHHMSPGPYHTPLSTNYNNQIHSSSHPSQNQFETITQLSPIPVGHHGHHSHTFPSGMEGLQTLPPIDKEFPGVCSYRPPNLAQQANEMLHYTPQNGHSTSPVKVRKLGDLSASLEFHKECNRTSHQIHKKSPSSHQASSTGSTAVNSNLCRICGKTYARPSTLKTHLRTHSGERPYRCDHCHKSFSQAANLTAHIRTHSGEKPFRCLVCDRRFSQSSSVTTHMRTHSGERPYRCRMCRKAFSDSSTLTKHLRIHSGEKPYQCRLCHLRFSQSGNLNRHMRIHSPMN